MKGKEEEAFFGVYQLLRKSFRVKEGLSIHWRRFHSDNMEFKLLNIKLYKGLCSYFQKCHHNLNKALVIQAQKKSF